MHAIERNFGAEGQRWLSELPARIASLERAWRVQWHTELESEGQCAVICLVRRHDGDDAILKLSFPHDEARHESDALRLWDGQGAARLLEASDDGFALLLERCVPGSNLWSLDVDAGNAVATTIAQRLWRPAAAPFIRLEALVDDWCANVCEDRRSAGYAPHIIEAALELGVGLCADAPTAMLLHGDLHPGNILASERAPWLAIDPKPIVGDPAFEWAQLIANRLEVAMTFSDPSAELTRQIREIAARCDHDPTRVAGWAFVKALGWDLGAEATALLHAMWRTLT